MPDSSPIVPAVTLATLADFTTPQLIVPHLSGRDAASVIQELSQALLRESCIPDLLPFYHSALNREFLVSTEMEAGMAFPHARLPGLPEVCFSLGRSDEPFRWGTRAAGPVRLIFLLAVPATDSTRYLLLISGLSRLASDHRLVAGLHTARDGFGMMEVLKRIELRNVFPSNPVNRKVA